MTATSPFGDRCELCFSCPELYTSQVGRDTLAYFRNIGFKRQECLGDDQIGDRVFSDGFVTIRVKAKGFPSPAISYVSTDMKKSVEKLDELEIKYEKLWDKKDKSKWFGVRFDSPCGVRMQIRQEEEGQGAFHSDQEQVSAAVSRVYEFDKRQDGPLGKFGHLVVPTDDLEASLRFWVKIGFRPGSFPSSPTEKTLSDGLMAVYVVAASNARAMDRPLIYFARDSDRRITALKDLGVEFFNEMDAFNACSRAPDTRSSFFLYRHPGRGGGGDGDSQGGDSEGEEAEDLGFTEEDEGAGGGGGAT